MNDLLHERNNETNLDGGERAVSGLVGVALFSMGIGAINEPGPKKWILFASSALLLFRGITGFSPVKSFFETADDKSGIDGKLFGNVSL